MKIAIAPPPPPTRLVGVVLDKDAGHPKAGDDVDEEEAVDKQAGDGPGGRGG